MRKKEKIILTTSYAIFIASIIFSRFSEGSVLNGKSGLSIMVYFGGVLFFVGSFIYIFNQRIKIKETEIFKNLNFNYILYFIVLTLGIIAARSGIRLIMVLGAVSPIAIAFLTVKLAEKSMHEKDTTRRTVYWIVAVIVAILVIFTMWNYFQQERSSAENFAPGVYEWQWQNAMKWVRENTPTTAVFAHWWDYGYWLQSIGQRATVLDGGNAIVYWNHLLGRLVLTGTSEKESLEFLYTHNATHLLVDSTDIRKYSAYASISSDADYDRLTQISTMVMDETQTAETQNETIYFFTGGAVIPEDITWRDNGTEKTFLKENSYVGAVMLKMYSGQQFAQPEAIIVSGGQQFVVPIRYSYFSGVEKDFGNGINNGIYIFPKMNVDSKGAVSINPIGALLYLDSRTINSEIVRLYLFDEKQEGFKLVHTESNYVISYLKAQNINLGEFVYYQDIQGPIKIWEINYPANIKSNPAYLEKKFPSQDLFLAKAGYYNN